MGMDGHCDPALFITHCLVSKDMVLLEKVWIISSNLAVGIGDDNGSTLAPTP